MVSTWVCTMMLCVATAGPDNASTAPVLSVWAVEAKTEGRETKKFDRALTPVRRALEGLPFDTFTCLAEFSEAVALGKEAEIPISGRYTLFLKPGRRLPDGRLVLDLRVEMPSRELRGKPVAALKAQVKLTPGKLLKVQGFHLEEGELILALRVDFNAAPKKS